MNDRTLLLQGILQQTISLCLHSIRMNSKQVLTRLAHLCHSCGVYKNAVFIIQCENCGVNLCRTCAALIKSGAKVCVSCEVGERLQCNGIFIACYGCGCMICKDCSAKCYREKCDMKYCYGCAIEILEDKRDCGGHNGNPNY